MRVYIKTYGCTLNQADSDLMANLLKESGASVVDSEAAADTVVVNTCTVKTPTEQKILNVIGKLEKSGKRIVVAGCMAGANQDLIEKYAPGASILTTSNVDKIAESVSQAASGGRTVFNDYNRADKLILFRNTHKDAFGDSVIAKVPVSEGCLSSCRFCETKFARGPLNSFSEELIVNAVALSVRRGAKEIQLTSQDMGAYGLDRKTDIAALMEKLAGIEGDFKIRVGMLNPEHLGKYLDRFIEALKSDRFYKFAHLPVQSGSNKVLREMKRMYTIEQFDEYVARLRAEIPRITIETDVIVGYPTETEEDFEQTLGFIRRIRPEVVNRCKFWSRPHAAASSLEQLPNRTIEARSASFTRTVRQVQQNNNDAFVGQTFNVIITEKEERSLNARADNYKKVIIKKGASNAPLGSRVRVKIGSASSNVLYGMPIETSKIVA